MKHLVQLIMLSFLGAMLMAVLLMPVGAFAQPPQAPVILGEADGFAILAGAAITNTPTSDITGDVGLSPTIGSGIIGLTASEVNGTIYTVDGSGPVGSVMSPELLTGAKSDLTMGVLTTPQGGTPEPIGAFLNPGSGNIGGMTLIPGLYKFTSTALITGANVILTGNAEDVWIFQIGATLTVGSGVQVILDGGAQAGNIFWQVGSSATLGTNCVFKGTIMADQSITLNTGAAIEGRALACVAAVTLEANTITMIRTLTPVVLIISVTPPDVELSWNPVPGADFYKIFTNTIPYFLPIEPPAFIVFSPDTSFIDAGAANFREEVLPGKGRELKLSTFVPKVNLSFKGAMII